MSAPGGVAGSYRDVRLAREALERQGFKQLNGTQYRVVRDHYVYDALVDVRDPLKKVVVSVTRQGKTKVKKEKKNDEVDSTVLYISELSSPPLSILPHYPIEIEGPSLLVHPRFVHPCTRCDDPLHNAMTEDLIDFDKTKLQLGTEFGVKEEGN